MNPIEKETRSITPEMVIVHFEKSGKKLSIKEAEKYLNLLYFLAKLVVRQQLL